MKVAMSSKKDLPDYWKEYIKSSKESSFKKGNSSNGQSSSKKYLIIISVLLFTLFINNP